MRYAKGTIAMSEASDLPLLRHIRDSRFITHNQLLAISGQQDDILAKRRFNWRVSRLVRAQYVTVVDARRNTERIYTISRSGVAYLEMFGCGLLSVTSTMPTLADASKMLHSLELNDIRIGLQQTGIVEAWKTDVQLSSENMEQGGVYAKDYDGVAWLKREASISSWGIEYERTAKAPDRYGEIRRVLSAERKLDGFVYFIRQFDRLVSMVERLAGAHRNLLFCSAEGFSLHGLNALAIKSGNEAATTTLGAALTSDTRFEIGAA